MTTPDPLSGESSLEVVAELLRLALSATPAAKMPGSARLDHRDRFRTDEKITSVPYGDVAVFVSQLMLVCLSSGLRSWGRAAEIVGKAVPLIGEAFSDGDARRAGDGGQRARNLDGLRAALRELTELTGQESRRLQAELERIVLGLGGPREPGTEPEPYWRRWEAKP